MEDNQNVFVVPRREKKKFSWKKGVIIFVCILAAILVFALIINKISGNRSTISSTGAYVGKISVEGTISESDSSYIFSDTTYHHDFLLKKIEEMKKDKDNKGILIYVNSPGGSVFASDELYLAIKDYQKKTNRPVYSYMASMAASGGYYISAPCDRIIANRNCWTGSIGVTMGTVWDVTGLLEKYGIKAQNITSGKNKAMGSSVEKMTPEQRAILQSLIDEAYSQFVGIVADGRKMDISKVKKLADGRIYTALQAKNVGLVDEIGTEESAFKDMKKRFKLDGDTELLPIEFEDDSFWGTFLNSVTGLKNVTSNKDFSDISQLKTMMKNNETFTISYMSEVRK